jgi:hypothetical protein
MNADRAAVSKWQLAKAGKEQPRHFAADFRSTVAYPARNRSHNEK